MTESDKELLMLAVKAVGCRVARVADDGAALLLEGVQRPWNPLTDDGDALRLAAALRLRIYPGKHHGDGCAVESQSAGVAGCTSFTDSGDMAEQMRRSITRVAANSARSLKWSSSE